MFAHVSFSNWGFMNFFVKIFVKVLKCIELRPRASMVSAASLTVAVMGPTVSWLLESGTTPSAERSPTVGLRPTIPHIDAGPVTEPSVSVPRAISTSPDPTAAPLPELEPNAVQEASRGLVVKPPTELHPLVEDVDRKLAHSERLVLPTMMAPARRWDPIQYTLEMSRKPPPK